MTPKYSLKQISDLSKEISKDLDHYVDNILTSDKEQFEMAIKILIETLIDLENI